MSRSTFSSSDTRTHLRVDGVSRSFAGRRVLTDISFIVAASDRAGLIGENGSGKSSLLRIAAGIDAPDAGRVQAIASGGVPPRIGLLHQEPPFAPTDTIAEALEAAIAPMRSAAADVDRRARSLADAPEDAKAAEAYARALDTAERLAVWDVDHRVGAVLDGVGVAGIARNRPTGELSDGQRARLSLAWVLLNAPDILLMDEPTNHLDDHAIDFVQRMIADWRGPVLFASHDRAFLDEAASTLLDLDPAPKPLALTSDLVHEGAVSGTGFGVIRFTGGYSDYLVAQADERRRWGQQYRDEQEEISRLRAAVSGSQQVGHSEWKPRTEQRGAQRFYADRNAKVVSRRVNDARSRLERLEAQQIRKPPCALKFAGLTVAVSPGASPTASKGPQVGEEPRVGDECRDTVLEVSNLRVDDRLATVSFRVSAGGRWLITGPNGSGKSTLLRAVAGQLEPTAGQVRARRGTSIGLLEQEVALPDPHGRGPGRSAHEIYADAVGTRKAARVPLSTFGVIAGSDEHRPVTQLSVGQQRRLALAILLAEPPEILLLDEPTNHLSLTLVEELESAIEHYPGSVLIASHDRRLRARWNGEVLPLAEFATANSRSRQFDA